MSGSASLTHLLPPSASSSTHRRRLLTPSTLPIPLLQTTLARRWSYAHTALVLGYYYLRSSALVSDPTATMMADLGVVAALQGVFCAVCLPSAGAWMSGTTAGAIVEGSSSSSSGTPKGGKSGKSGGATGSTPGSIRKKLGPGAGVKGAGKSNSGGGDASWSGRIMPTLFALILALVLPPLPLGVIALVLGAPLYPTSLLPLTFLLALHVSVLGFLPLFYTHGVSALAWRDVAAAWLPFDESGVWAGTVGCLVGGWVGAVPMALDWDREWQKWPCTVLWGCVLSWGVGRAFTNVLRWGINKRIDLSEAGDPVEEEFVQSVIPSKAGGSEKKSD